MPPAEQISILRRTEAAPDGAPGRLEAHRGRLPAHRTAAGPPSSRPSGTVAAASTPDPAPRWRAVLLLNPDPRDGPRPWRSRHARTRPARERFGRSAGPSASRPGGCGGVGDATADVPGAVASKTPPQPPKHQ